MGLAPRAFASWFRRLIFKQCDCITRKKKLPDIAPELADTVSSMDVDQSELLELKDSDDALHQAIDRLPESKREVTTAYYINSFSQRDIAGFLDIPVSTVNYRLHSARKRLKKELEQMTDSKKTVEHSAIAQHVGSELRAIQALHEEFAGTLTIVFSVAMSRKVNVELVAATKSTYGEFVRSRQRHSCVYYFNVEPLKGHVTWDLTMSLALASLSRIRDGEELTQEVEARMSMPTDRNWISNYQIGLLARLCKLVVLLLEDIWAPTLPVSIGNIEYVLTPALLLKDARLTPENESIVQFDVEVKVPGFTDLVTSFCYPQAMLEEVLERTEQIVLLSDR